MFNKMLVKISLVPFLLAGMVIAYQTTVANAQTSPAFETEKQICNNTPQAGKATVTLTSDVTLTAAPFILEFCETPIVIASGGENVDNVQIGVVTTRVAWFLLYGKEGQVVNLYWQAMEPTQ